MRLVLLSVVAGVSHSIDLSRHKIEDIVFRTLGHGESLDILSPCPADKRDKAHRLSGVIDRVLTSDAVSRHAKDQLKQRLTFLYKEDLKREYGRVGRGQRKWMGDAHSLRIALRKDYIEAEMKNLDREIGEERKKRHSELRAAARKNMIYRIFRSGGHEELVEEDDDFERIANVSILEDFLRYNFSDEFLAARVDS